MGPNGHFQVKVPVAKNIIFVATGTGISPYIPMLEFLLDNSCDSKINLIHGFRDETNLEYYKSLHNEFALKCQNFSSTIFISQPQTISDQFQKGRVTDYLKKLDKNKLLDSQIYLCGHPEMISESVSYLIKLGIKEENLMYEAFTSPGAYEKIS